MIESNHFFQISIRTVLTLLFVKYFDLSNKLLLRCDISFAVILPGAIFSITIVVVFHSRRFRDVKPLYRYSRSSFIHLTKHQYLRGYYIYIFFFSYHFEYASYEGPKRASKRIDNLPDTAAAAAFL